MNGGSSSEKASGKCDGIGFSRESTCCKDHGYQKCPYTNGCFDFNEGRLPILPMILIT